MAHRHPFNSAPICGEGLLASYSINILPKCTVKMTTKCTIARLQIPDLARGEDWMTEQNTREEKTRWLETTFTRSVYEGLSNDSMLPREEGESIIYNPT